MKITAVGVRDNKKMEVIYDGTDFWFNGFLDDFLSSEIRFEMSQLHPIGGTFYVDDINDVRNIINVLKEYFFDKPILDVKCSDEVEPIPQDGEKGSVY